MVAYDGTELAGWQRQRGRPTVQGALEDALLALTGRQVAVTGAGRTDAGVHATGQVAHFDIDWNQPVDRLAAALNARLPAAVAVLGARQVGPGFHARHGASRRHYRYQIWQGGAWEPTVRRGCHRVPDRLVVPWMAAAAARFEGVHDFRAFGRPVMAQGTTIRRVDRCTVRAEGPLIVLDVEATAFLRHQIRRMVALLVDIGRGRWEPDAVSGALLGDLDGPRFGRAPANGLTLAAVWYPPDQGTDLEPARGAAVG